MCSAVSRKGSWRCIRRTASSTGCWPLVITGPSSLRPVQHFLSAELDRDLPAQPSRRPQLRPAPTAAVPHRAQIAPNRRNTGRQQELFGAASEVDLAMSGERGKEVGKEWLQALGTDVAGGLPEQREREAKVLTVAAPSRLSKNRLWTSTPATQQRHRVLAVVASGQAKGIQQFPPQPLARR